jgi:nucleotide-binding universal stress UspA family protein
VYKKILVPLDGSELAESALAHVVPLAKCLGSEIALFRVLSVPVGSYMLVTEPRLIEEAAKGAEDDAHAYLKDVAEKLRADGLKVSFDVGAGAIGETIQEYATNIHADLIAMCTHGRGGLARLVIGSVADQLLRHSKIPILLARPKMDKN